MTPLFSLLPLAKPPPVNGQDPLRLLSQTLDACALALNGFSLLRSTLAAIQARSIPGSHQSLLARLSIEVLDDYAARLQQLSTAVQDEQQGTAPLPFHAGVGGGAGATCR